MDSIKLVMVGDEESGKTRLLVSFIGGDYSPEEHKNNLFSKYSSRIQLSKRIIQVTIHDTNSQDQYYPLRKIYYKDASAIIICFSVVDRESFKNVKKKWYPEVHRKCPKLPIILVGTKIDLRSNKDVVDQLESNNSRPVTYAEGLEMKKKIKAYKYLGLFYLSIFSINYTSKSLLLKIEYSSLENRSNNDETVISEYLIFEKIFAKKLEKCKKSKK